MKEAMDFTPLEEYLNEEIGPADLALLLDELAYEYARINLRLQKTEDPYSLFIHPDADKFMFHLKALRDRLRQCIQ